MTKKIAKVLVLLIAVFALTGCAGQTTVSLKVEGIEGAYVQQIPTNIVGCNMIDNEVVNLVLKRDGDYVLNFKDKDENDYPVTVKLHGGEATVDAPEGVSVAVSVK